MSDLPVNVDTTYGDDPANASVQLHQQHHDAIHALYNDIAGATPDLASLGIQANTAPVTAEVVAAWALNTSGSVFYDLDPDGTAAARPRDIVIDGVQDGDFVEYGVSLYSAAAANGHYMVAATIVDGAVVNQIIPSSWILTTGVVGTPSGSIQIPVTAADIDDGSVRIRLQGFRITGSSARTLGSAAPLLFWGCGPF